MIATLLYFRARNVPLTALELSRFLPMHLDPPSLSTLEDALGTLVQQQRIVTSHGLYSIDGDVDLVHRRRLYCASLTKWYRASRAVRRMRWIPFLRMVSLTNTVALNAAEEESDIDLLIIGSNGRLWTVRWAVTAITQLLGIRRHGSYITNRLCLSFYCSDSALGLQRFCVGQRDVHYAYWVGMTAMMFEAQGSGTQEKFESENQWVKEYFSQHHWLGLTPVFGVTDSKVSRIIRAIWEWMLGGWMGDRIEAVLRFLQRRMIYAHTESRVHHGGVDVVVEDDVFKFHESDSRAQHRKLWTEQCQKYGVTIV